MPIVPLNLAVARRQCAMRHVAPTNVEVAILAIRGLLRSLGVMARA
jgi:hypothetical protein